MRFLQASAYPEPARGRVGMVSAYEISLIGDELFQLEPIPGMGSNRDYTAIA